MPLRKHRIPGGPFCRPKCELCGRPYEAHSLNTRDICNFYLEPDDDVRRTVPGCEGDAGGAGQGGMVSGDAASKEDIRSPESEIGRLHAALELCEDVLKHVQKAYNCPDSPIINKARLEAVLALELVGDKRRLGSVDSEPLAQSFEPPWWKILADNWRGRKGNTTTGDSVRNTCADELEKMAGKHSSPLSSNTRGSADT